jgi:hypothetical protein
MEGEPIAEEGLQSGSSGSSTRRRDHSHGVTCETGTIRHDAFRRSAIERESRFRLRQASN